jgi:phosphohistidine phosphatase
LHLRTSQFPLRELLTMEFGDLLPKIPQIERPLSKRGRLFAPPMGALLREKELVPHLILSSTAVRACMTAEFVAAGAEFTGDIKYFTSLYLAEPRVYLGALSAVPDTNG